MFTKLKYLKESTIYGINLRENVNKPLRMRLVIADKLEQKASHVSVGARVFLNIPKAM